MSRSRCTYCHRGVASANRLRQLSVTGWGSTIGVGRRHRGGRERPLTGLLGKTVWRPRVSTDPALVRAIYFLPYRSPWCRGWLVIAGVLAPRVHLDSV